MVCGPSNGRAPGKVADLGAIHLHHPRHLKQLAAAAHKGVRQPVAVFKGLEVARAGEQQALADAARLRLALQVHPTRVGHAHTLAGIILLLQLVLLRLGFLFVGGAKGSACSHGIMSQPLPPTFVMPGQVTLDQRVLQRPSIPRTHVFGEEVSIHPRKLTVDVLLLDHLFHPVHCRPVVRTAL